MMTLGSLVMRVALLLWASLAIYILVHFTHKGTVPNGLPSKSSFSRSLSQDHRQLYSAGSEGVSQSRLIAGVNQVSRKDLSFESGFRLTQVGDGVEAYDMESPDRCAGLYFYIYEELVAPFNEEILLGCRNLGGHELCNALQNGGRGMPDEELCRQEQIDQERLAKPESKEAAAKADIPADCSWFTTNQFSLEVLLHHRLREHPCRVNDPSAAKLFYVPFYTGLEIKRMWGNHRATAQRFNQVFNPLVNSPYFRKNHGADHFMAFGRMGMEFGFYPGFVTWLGNVSKLMIEVGWDMEGYRTGREIGLPYPTGFHPAGLSDVKRHREAVRGASRNLLVSYAGAVGRPYGIWAQRFGTTQLRTRLAQECERMGDTCHLVICDYAQDTCSPTTIHDLFMSSTFCLQPQGDSPTRRSTFDALLAGCIPIFFHTDSFQSQYEGLLGVNASEVSILIPADRIRDGSWSLQRELETVDEPTRKRMRDLIVELLPRLVYGRKHVGDDWKDAVDIVLERVGRNAATL